MSGLRPYQIEAKHGCYAAWQAARNALLVMPTGAGKTRTLADMVAEMQRATCVIAHRQELVGQLSVALARERIRHGIIAPKEVVRDIVKLQIEEVGASYFDPNARTKVAGVDTLIKANFGNDPWPRQVGLWVIDEAHHQQETNKWGKAAALFPNALGLGVTATPCRADGKGLGRGHGGVFEQMVEGPQMRWLIEQGFLTDYDVAHFQSDVNYAEVGLSAGGDLSPRAHAAAVHKSARIVGDVVRHYQRLAAGKRGITFAVDVEEAEKLANAYKAADIPAAVIHGKMRDSERTKIMRLFRSGQILQLCNCDILGEGVDVPAVEVVSMARKTMSYSLFAQQFGRMLRPFEGKARGLLIDHVGNFNHHKPPDRRRIWSLDGEVRMQAPKDGVAMRTCAMCAVPYEAFFPSCPNCGHEPLPVERRTPQQVDGDLTLLDADVLAAMRAEYDEIDRAARVPPGATQMIIDHLKNVKWEKQEAQKSLRDAIARWGGARTIEGLDVRTAQRRFFHELGIDILSAQALGPREAAELEKRVKASW